MTEPTDDELRAAVMAEAAYPSEPFHQSGTLPWPQSYRNAFIRGYLSAMATR